MVENIVLILFTYTSPLGGQLIEIAMFSFSQRNAPFHYFCKCKRVRQYRSREAYREHTDPVRTVALVTTRRVKRIDESVQTSRILGYSVWHVFLLVANSGRIYSPLVLVPSGS